MFTVIATLFVTALPIHLADVLDEAQTHNADIAAASARARASKYLTAASTALDDPMLSVQLWNMPLDFSTVPLMVELSQPLLLGDKRAARHDLAEAEQHVAEALLQQQRRELDGAVATAYFDVFMAEETLRVNEQLARTLGTLLDVATNRSATGIGETADALRLQSEIIKLEGDSARLVAERAGANARLAAFLDRPFQDDVGSPAPPAGPVTLPSQTQLRQAALKNRPEIQTVDAMLHKAQAEVRLAQADGTPDIAPMIGYMHNFRGEGATNFAIVGVQGNLPVYRDAKLAPRIAAAQANLDALRAGARALQNRIGAEIATIYAQAEAEAHTIAVHHRLIPISQQALSSAISSYVAGRSSFLVVLDSERDLQMHQLDLARHVSAYEQRLADLERASTCDLGLKAAAGQSPLHMHEGVPP